MPKSRGWITPFSAGILLGGAGFLLARGLSRPGFDPRLVRRAHKSEGLLPVVVVPGVMGSSLLRPDGTPAWLNLGNAVGSHNLGLPLSLPLTASRDDLRPGALLGTEAYMPRFFGFTEYFDIQALLEAGGLVQYVFAYDWRRDLVESAHRLHEMLESLAEASGDPDARFNVVGHSMGGLVARYYLRYGTAEPGPDAPVTWAGARRIANLVLVAVPSGGSIPALEALLYGSRVGLSYTTLAAAVVARMPALYQLLPTPDARPLVDHRAVPIEGDLLDPALWERFGWGPFAARTHIDRELRDVAAYRTYLEAVLARARDFRAALERQPDSRCPVRVVVLGGDCLPTLGRCLVPARHGALPRFEAATRAEAEVMYEAGDGRVTRASVTASHLPGAHDSESGTGLSEVAHAIFGSADHHGIYQEPTFQSILLRLLLKPHRAHAARA